MSQTQQLISLSGAGFRGQPMHSIAVSEQQWEQASRDLAAGGITLLSLWASDGAVHMALMDDAGKQIAILCLELQEKSFPAVSRCHLPALRLERAITDLFGYQPTGSADSRPWLDHGRWDVTNPMTDQSPSVAPAAYEFLPVEGESLHKVAVGPVHAGIIEPGHFRFTVQGETVVRLEEKLGYVHKGIDRLMRGASLQRGAEIAGRTSGDSTVAYAWAFAEAAESALGTTPPERALMLRCLMAELERLANHLGDIGAVCNDAAFALIHAHTSVLRERVLRASEASFGHRMMRDKIIPGGVSVDLSTDGKHALTDLLETIRKRYDHLVSLYENTASLMNRTHGTGCLNPELAKIYGAGGFVGRASGRNFDTRRDLGYAPYDSLRFEVPTLNSGDVHARVWIRIQEVYQSLSLIEQCLQRLPDGPISSALPVVGEARDGLGMIEGFRGDVLVWLALDADGMITRCHMRDPSWFHWPLLEVVIEDNIIADFPLCNKSFNCSYAGHDL